MHIKAEVQSEKKGNIYSNIYLGKLLPAWNEDAVQATAQKQAPLQRDFYSELRVKKGLLKFLWTLLEYSCHQLSKVTAFMTCLMHGARFFEA